METIKKIVEIDFFNSFVSPNNPDLEYYSKDEKKDILNKNNKRFYDLINIIIENSNNTVLIKLIDRIQNIILNLRSVDGYCIITNNNLYFILINNFQQCCENYGIITSNDDLTYYEGSEFKSIETIDEPFDKNNYERNAMFVNIETSKGLLQFNIYNTHNGYYGHNVEIKDIDNVLYNETL